MSKIRLGGFPVDKKQPLPVVPNNYGMAQAVNDEIERTLAVANARFDEALQVNPVPVMIWRRTQRGFVCTCQAQDKPVVDANDTHPPDTNDPTQAYTKPNVIRVQGARDLASQSVHPQDRVLGVDIGVRDADAGNTPTFTEEHNDAAGTGTEVDPKFFDYNVFRSGLDAGQAVTRCGICFGTGFTDGYALYGGQRIVLDSHNVVSLGGFGLANEEDAPITYRGSEGAVLTWTVAIPTFFKNAWIHARNNTAPADVDLQVNGAELPVAGLTAFKGQTVTVTAKALQDATEITHIEIVLQFTEWPNIQMDNIAEDLTYNAPESTQTLDFSFSPKVQKMEREDVFMDLKYGKVWRANTVTDDRTTSGIAVVWTVSATSRTSFDILSLLRVTYYPQYQLGERPYVA